MGIVGGNWVVGCHYHPRRDRRSRIDAGRLVGPHGACGGGVDHSSIAASRFPGGRFSVGRINVGRSQIGDVGEA